MSQFELTNKIDVPQLAVAVSGGIDSVVLLHYLLKKLKHTQICIAHFNHGNEFANEETRFIAELASNLNIPLIFGQSTEIEKPANKSKEEHWRDCRYQFFRGLNMPVATGHTLDDCVEWYIFSALHGEGRYLEYRHANVIRPFLLTPKAKITKYAEKQDIEWLEDWSNADVEFAARNRIRHLILPEALKVNPGLMKVVRKKVLEKARANNK